MFSFNTNKFRNVTENRYGRKPTPEKLNFDTTIAKEYLSPVPIWETLNITEEEYYEKYHKQPVQTNAMDIQKDIENAETENR